MKSLLYGYQTHVFYSDAERRLLSAIIARHILNSSLLVLEDNSTLYVHFKLECVWDDISSRLKRLQKHSKSSKEEECNKLRAVLQKSFEDREHATKKCIDSVRDGFLEVKHIIVAAQARMRDFQSTSKKRWRIAGSVVLGILSASHGMHYGFVADRLPYLLVGLLGGWCLESLAGVFIADITVRLNFGDFLGLVNAQHPSRNSNSGMCGCCATVVLFIVGFYASGVPSAILGVVFNLYDYILGHCISLLVSVFAGVYATQFEFRMIRTQAVVQFLNRKNKAWLPRMEQTVVDYIQGNVSETVLTEIIKNEHLEEVSGIKECTLRWTDGVRKKFGSLV